MDRVLRRGARYTERGYGIPSEIRGGIAHASIETMSGCLLNIILDPIFYSPPWGFNMGAPERTRHILSNCVACIYFFFLLYVRRSNTLSVFFRRIST